MKEKLIALIASELSVSKEGITLETDLQDDLGADSLDAVELMMAVEDAFNVSIPDQETQGLRTVGDILRLVENKLK
ncbi:MAG: acyl carrier protein [Candidatus Izemoplasmatales bacterium]|nr:acyl carrier protein [Candidatus Izemoplasmatales bacterium]MDD5294007.1 acyl carrier protein [Candidatus Izemoplasmatales bacterium]